MKTRGRGDEVTKGLVQERTGARRKVGRKRKGEGRPEVQGREHKQKPEDNGDGGRDSGPHRNRPEPRRPVIHVAAKMEFPDVVKGFDDFRPRLRLP